MDVLLVAVEMLEQFETAVALELVLTQDEFRPRSGFTSNKQVIDTSIKVTKKNVNRIMHLKKRLKKIRLFRKCRCLFIERENEKKCLAKVMVKCFVRW